MKYYLLLALLLVTNPAWGYYDSRQELQADYERIRAQNQINTLRNIAGEERRQREELEDDIDELQDRLDDYDYNND